MHISCTAIIVAAGHGTRFGGDMPKQFALLDDKPIVFHSVAVFATNPQITRIVLVVQPEYQGFCRQHAQRLGFCERLVYVDGGATRQQSVFNALACVDDDIVLIHDGARPFVSNSAINAVISSALLHGAATLALPVTDTIKRGKDGFAEQTLPRDGLYAIQTPQGFKADVLKQVHKHALKEGFEAADDCHLVEQLGVAVAIVPGESTNIKITYDADLAIAESLTKGGWIK